MNSEQLSAHLRNLTNEEFLNSFADNETLCGPYAQEMRRRINEELVLPREQVAQGVEEIGNHVRQKCGEAI